MAPQERGGGGKERREGGREERRRGDNEKERWGGREGGAGEKIKMNERVHFTNFLQTLNFHRGSGLNSESFNA